MIPTFTICIASHGSDYWRDIALRRPLPSAQRQGPQILIEHDPDADRATVRNRLAEQADTDYLIFLDADDELAPDYVGAMKQTWMQGAILEDWHPLLVPRVQYVRRGLPDPPKFWPEPRELHAGNNWMVVGTGVPRELFHRVGGWRTFTGTGMLNEYDDWDLWLRCQLAGATPVKVHDAVYMAHVSRTSPHRSVSTRQAEAWKREIQHANFPELYP